MLPLRGRISLPQNMTLCVIGRVRFERNCGKMYSPFFRTADWTKRSCDIIFIKMKVICFCLQKTVSGSYLKQNNSYLVFQARTIFLN